MLIVFHATAALCALVCLFFPLRGLIQPSKAGEHDDSFSFLFCASAAMMELLALQCLARQQDWAKLTSTIVLSARCGVALFVLMAILIIWSRKRLANAAGK